MRSAIVEGYGRKHYKKDQIRFAVYALASNDETLDHLEILHETKSLTDEATYSNLHAKITPLGKKLNLYLQALIRESER